MLATAKAGKTLEEAFYSIGLRRSFEEGPLLQAKTTPGTAVDRQRYD